MLKSITKEYFTSRPGQVFIVHSAGHPLKSGGTYGVKGHTLNQPNL